jgi:serine/threonine-protein kinase
VHAALISDRIVRCYVVSNDPNSGDVCIAMEFVPGGDARRLAGPASDLRQIVALGADLFEALACGHQRGLVHRDVKPGNILLTLPDASGLARGKLADYGLAKSLQDVGGGTTATGMVAGSPLFAAPEQLLNFKSAGTSADIYGAAATLYHLLTRQHPIPLSASEKEAGVAAVCIAVLDVARVPLRTRRPDVPPQFADWLDAMVQRDPVHRARAGAAEVARWLAAWR